ncbi:MAG: hypothetical protein ACKVU0_06355 [Saprospiraceae bacterium]
MYKFFMTLGLVSVLMKPLFAQYFTGRIYGEPVTVQIDSVGKNAWQGYLVYAKECYSVALVRIDSQAMASEVKHGFVGLKIHPEPSFGFSISGDPDIDSIRLTEQEIKQIPTALVPERTTVTLQKSEWPENKIDLIWIERYKQRFALESPSIKRFDIDQQVPCNFDPNLLGIWEMAGGKIYLSIHADGNMMMFTQDNRERIWGELSEYLLPFRYTVWCAGAGLLYINRVNGNARLHERYTIEQDKLTLTLFRTNGEVFHRK